MDDAAEPNGEVYVPCVGKVEVYTKEEGFVIVDKPDSVDKVHVDLQKDMVALNILGWALNIGKDRMLEVALWKKEIEYI